MTSKALVIGLACHLFPNLKKYIRGRRDGDFRPVSNDELKYEIEDRLKDSRNYFIFPGIEKRRLIDFALTKAWFYWKIEAYYPFAFSLNHLGSKLWSLLIRNSSL